MPQISVIRTFVTASAFSLFQAFGTAAFADIDKGLAALDTGDVATAASEFQSSFQSGEGDGAFYLGRLFEFGLGTEADMSRAANLYAAGAEIGSVLAMNRLGLLYLEGTTLLRDYTEAARLFCNSADAGDQTGQLNCALMLKDGNGVAANAEEAVRYFDLAAQQGNIAAKNLLGQMLATGDGVPADADAARELFVQTALEGNAMGLFELAKSFLAEDDLVQAYAYANLATVRQHTEARELRDRLEAQMSSDQINAGQEQAKVWTASRIAEQAAAQQAQSE